MSDTAEVKNEMKRNVVLIAGFLAVISLMAFSVQLVQASSDVIIISHSSFYSSSNILYIVGEVENTGDTPSDFVRIEFKTEPVNPRGLHSKFQPEEYPAPENFLKVQFENEQIRATRLAVAPRKKLTISTATNEPALVVALIPASLKLKKGKAGPSKLSIAAGKTQWIEQGAMIEFENTGDAPAELLRFDLKTKPLSADQIKAPDHNHN